MIDQTQPTTPPVEAVQAAPQPVAEQPQTPSDPKKKAWLIFAVAVFIALIVGGGIAYGLYVMNSKTGNETQQVYQQQPAAPTPSSEEEQQLQEIPVGDEDNSDIIEVEKDLQTL